MDSKTTIKWIDGKEYRIELVDTKQQTSTPSEFVKFYNLKNKKHPLYLFTSCNFFFWIETYNLKSEWESYLIAEARKRGFISGCTIKTATDMDKMKSGRLKLIGLSKLATDGRKSIIIYDNGKWVAEAIPEVKKYWWNEDRAKWFNTSNWTTGELLTRDEMEKIKCEPEYN